MQGRWHMSELKYNQGDIFLLSQIVFSTLRYKCLCHHVLKTLILQICQIWALLTQFQRAIQKQIITQQMSSQGALWSLWIDNRIKSKKL
jgi:hypothetical protein